MKLALIFVKRLLINPYAIGFGIAFTYFFIAMGAFILSSNYEYSPVYYTASWYGTVVLMSTSMFASSIGMMISYHSGGLSFLTRFSRLTPKYYLLSLYLTVTLTLLIVSVLMSVGVISLFSYRFGELILPKDWGLSFFDVVLSGMFYVPLVLLLEEATVVTSRKLSRAVAFIPYFLAIMFGFFYSNSDSTNMAYYNPFVVIELLAEQSFSTKPIPLNYNDLHGPTLNIGYSIASVLIWSLLLSLASIAMLRRLYYKPLEEGRFV
ncbi:hypothetical protein [Stygiolobus caldivivus]|uniref:Uncharacterized protein n=1 Tax=Stygiolobus caldivivus TaxID=2824673 RepID=A0A8D5U5F0_9CREN|nr:hypothetical protein [Stygiolobus caldivivus]BCU69633.1 hypothetical protein KN1_09300 [Stygiolobus caldivivus]